MTAHDAARAGEAPGAAEAAGTAAGSAGAAAGRETGTRDARVPGARALDAGDGRAAGRAAPPAQPPGAPAAAGPNAGPNAGPDAGPNAGGTAAGPDASDRPGAAAGTAAEAGPEGPGTPPLPLADEPLAAAVLPEVRPRMRGRVTVQVWFNAVLSAMVLLVVVFAVIGSQLLARDSSISDRLANRVQPARVEGVRLQTALLDQETGVRGYVLSHDPQFLQPYQQGLAEERTVIDRLRPMIDGDARATAELRGLEQAAAQWRRQYAQRLVEHARQGVSATADKALLDGGKQAFDALRARFDVEDAHLLADRESWQAQLRHVQTERDGVFSAMLATFLAAALVLALMLRQIVGRPLNRLRRDALRVAAGDFESPIPADGPADLRVLGEAVEAMRRGLAGALAEARDQRGLLSAQAEELTAQAKELRRSNSELEQFAYVASHDLQEPLRKVASFCQLLEKRYRDQLDARGVQYIDFAVDGAKRMQILITDLLAFSRVGRTQDARLPVRLDSALDHALANLAGPIEDTGARIVRPAEMPEVVGDPTLLTMVWQNLVANAVKFRAPDRPPVIQIESETGPDGEYAFSVTDNGIGIPPEFSEKVFVIFQRLHSRDVYEGTGIGLAMCRKIIEHHGGRIAVDTSRVDGTRIRFTLPAVPAAPAEAQAPTEGAHTA